MRDEDSDEPVLVLPEGQSPWALLAVVLFGLSSVSVTITILTVSIPRIARDLHSTEGTLTWVVAGPILAFGVIGPAVGKLGDLWGQRRVYLFGLAGAAAMAAASAMAWSAQSLIAFRVLGAIEGAATGPASFAIISLVFPARDRVRALGFWSMTAAGAPVIGVVIGGPLVTTIGWRAIFVCQVPLCLAAFAVAYRLLPETPRHADRTFDWAGAGLLAATVTPLLWSINQGPATGWTDPVVVAGFVLAPLALLAFVAVERRAAQPLLPLKYLKSADFALPLIVIGLLNAAYMGSFVLTPLLLENVLGFDETKTGLLSVARPLSFSITAALSGLVAVRLGERLCGVLGAAILAVAMVWMSSLAAGSTSFAIVGGLALAGVALGIAMPSMSACVTHAVDPTDLGMAGATQQLTIQIGISLGIQVMHSVQEGREGAIGQVPAFGEAYLLGAALAVIALGVAVFVRRLPKHSMDLGAALVVVAHEGA